jgi:hypothetical protein
MQTSIEQITKAEARLNKMMAYAGTRCRELAEEQERIERERKKWFIAFHEMRTLVDVGHEEHFDEKRMQSLLDRSVGASEEFGAAYVYTHEYGGE